MSGRAARRGAVALVAAALVFGVPAQANEAAHKMAEKFAGATKDAGTPQDSERKAQAEADTAKKRENERKAQQAKAKAAKEAAEAKQRAAAKAAQAAKAAHEARIAAEQRKADEADMLARARREAEERAANAEHTKLADEARRLIEEAERERLKAEALLAGHGVATKPVKVESVPVPTPGAAKDAAARAEAAAIAERERAAEEEARLFHRRAEETRLLADKLKRVRQIREARLAAQARREADAARTAAAIELPPAPAPAIVPPAQPPEPAAEPVRTAEPATIPPPPMMAGGPPEDSLAQPPLQPGSRVASAPPGPPSVPPPEAAPAMPVKVGSALRETRVTVLLILEPGTYGIRRNGPKVADPLICTLEGCYVSAGADQPARFLPGRKALGVGNTLGGRAGACRQSLGCAFRNVELNQLPGYLQPVDLHILKHDRRRGQVVSADSGCVARTDRLYCSRAFHADDYVMWVVPESVADAAGPGALQRALADGLNSSRSAELAPGR